MKSLFYGVLLTYSLIQIWIDQNKFTLNDLTIILIITLFIIILLLIKEKFLNNIYFSFFFYLIITTVVFIYNYFYGFITLIAFDIMYKRYYYFGTIFLILPIYFIINLQIYNFIFILLFTIISGFFFNNNIHQKKHYQTVIDNERRLRYELEAVKHELIQNSKEIERITEIKERNRIARDIHDNIGHDIAGVLIQLQAAEKLIQKDINKSQNILSLCINKLSLALEMTRNTVYNIKPIQEINENIFKDIIDKFIFSKINYQFNGDINLIRPEILEILITNLKESLTNSAKYSGATEIDIKIEANKNYVRFYYKDNGKGCKEIVDGLGLSGMKERIKAQGGMINIDGNNGFSIITIIPNIKTSIFQ